MECLQRADYIPFQRVDHAIVNHPAYIMIKQPVNHSNQLNVG